MIALPIPVPVLLQHIIEPALRLLPAPLDSAQARVMLVAIALQESNLSHRWQVLNSGGKGPARGLWQFERGTEAGRGGVWGVYLHPASAALLRQVCGLRGVACTPLAIWHAIETDDILAAAVARLLLLTDPFRLPPLHDANGAWQLYALRCWRPGKPHPQTWGGHHARAVAACTRPGEPAQKPMGAAA